MGFARERNTVRTFLEPRAEIDLDTSGDNVIIAGIAGQKIRIYKLILWAQAATTVILKDGAETINGAGFNMAGQSMFAYDADYKPLTMGKGNGFTVNLGTSVVVTGWVEYTQVGE